MKFGELTDIDIWIYEYVKDHMLKHGYAPTTLKIKRFFGVKDYTLDNAIKRLGKLGYWEYKGNASAITIPGIKMMEIGG